MCEHNYQIANISKEQRRVLVEKNYHTENEYMWVTIMKVTLFCTKCGEIKQHTIEE